MKKILIISLGLTLLSWCSILNNNSTGDSVPNNDMISSGVVDPYQAAQSDNISDQPQQKEVLGNISEEVKIENNTNDTF